MEMCGFTPQEEDYIANFGTAYILTDIAVKVFDIDPLVAGSFIMMARLIKEYNDGVYYDPNDIYCHLGGISFKYVIGF